MTATPLIRVSARRAPMGSALYAGASALQRAKNAIVPLVLTIRRRPLGAILFEKGLGADIMAVCSAPMYSLHDETFCADVPPLMRDSARMLPTRCGVDAVASVPRLIYPPG